MPKLKNPLLSQEARGGIAGLVFNTWRGINTVKTNTSPTGQGTAKRLAAQARISAISKEWATLTDVQRAAWSQYATDHPVTDWTGSPKRLTGMNWFVKCNALLDMIGEAHVTAAPGVAAPDPMTGFNLTFATGTISAVWTAPTAATKEVVFFSTGPQSKGITGKIEQAQYLSHHAASETTPLAIITGATTGRYTVFAKIIDTVTGLESTWQSDFVDAT